MDHNENKEVQEWYRKRTWTTVLATIQAALLFFEYSAFSLSGLYYWETEFTVANPKLFYSASMGIVFVSGLLSASACGHYMNRTGDLRSIVVVTMTLNALGNLMYTFTISPFLPLTGRFLAGVNMGVQTAVSGEFSRVYKPDQLAAVLSKYTIMSTLTMTIAPFSSPIFYGVNIQIGWWRLTSYNFACLLIAIAALLVTIISYFKVSNLTNEPAYTLVKSEFVIEDEDESKKPNLLTLKDIMSDFELMVILGVESFIAYQYQLEVLTNMITISIFGWSILHLAIPVVASILILTTIIYAIEKTSLLRDTKNIYFMYVFAFISILLANNLIMFIVFSDLMKGGKYWQSLIICLQFSLIYFPYFGSTLYCRSLIFFITPSHSASIVESYRLFLQQLFMAFSYFVASYAYDCIAIVLVTYWLIAFFIVLLLLFCFKQKYFKRLIRVGNEKLKGQ